MKKSTKSQPVPEDLVPENVAESTDDEVVFSRIQAPAVESKPKKIKRVKKSAKSQPVPEDLVPENEAPEVETKPLKIKREKKSAKSQPVLEE